MKSEKRNRKPLKWSRLDNVAKIFPPTSYGADTGVFRLSSELHEEVNPSFLQIALEETLDQFPHMKMVMRRGLFWYYLEQTMQMPAVEPENKWPCAALYDDSKSLLFRVSYWRNKINLEVFHVLADGAGGIAFFKALLAKYLKLSHAELSDVAAPPMPQFGREKDSFQKYYKPNSRGKTEASYKAYRLRGIRRSDDRLAIIEGVANVKEVLAAAHRYGVTLTVYLTAVLIDAIHEEMYLRDEKKPVVLTVPVDLRGYFPSETTRNFFGTIRVSYHFKKQSGEFEDILQSIAASFKKALTPENLAARMNKMASLEHNLLLRAVPLVLKNPVLRISGDIAERGETAVISNVGKFSISPEFDHYVKGFSAFMSTHALQVCTASFGENIHFGFTSALEEPSVQRHFFKKLVQEGIAVEIRSNEFHKEDS